MVVKSSKHWNSLGHKVQLASDGLELGTDILDDAVVDGLLLVECITVLAVLGQVARQRLQLHHQR